MKYVSKMIQNETFFFEVIRINQTQKPHPEQLHVCLTKTKNYTSKGEHT